MSTALVDALRSGEFLVYDQQSGGLVESPWSQILRALLATLDHIRGLSGRIAELAATRDTLNESLSLKGSEFKLPRYTLAFLFRMHDVLDDLLRLSTALERHILNPGSNLEIPPLNPITPYEDEITQVEVETPSHDDVRRWVASGLLQS